MSATLDPRVIMGAVTLSVADLGRSMDYYQNSIGLRLQDKEGNSAVRGRDTCNLQR